MSILKKLLPITAITGLALVATPAMADTISLGAPQTGQDYTLAYDGFANSTTINGLTASTTFTLSGISGNTYNFNYSVTNTSTAPITDSRVSSFAFNTDPNITSASSTGAFAFTTLNSNYPNAIGTVDVCFKDAQTGSCAGGGSGGLGIGETGTGTFSLTFAQPVSTLTLSDFFVRYQSIAGAGNVTSASGSGSLTSTSTTSGGTQVPEPGMLGLFGTALIATALVRRRRTARTALRPALA